MTVVEDESSGRVLSARLPLPPQSSLENLELPLPCSNSRLGVSR